MFLLSRPSEEAIRQFLAAQNGAAFSYPETGATRAGDAPAGYTVDHNRQLLGTGRAVFERAVAAVRGWRMFALGWTELCFPDTPIQAGATVAVLVNHLGFWSLNAARIVYVLDETTGGAERFGFAYGTLEAHGERGEERFSVEFHAADASVWYDLYAFSQPQHFLARLGYPVSRMFQKRFAADSKQAMMRAVER
jgi:uncharacterized protein (UPF0548 family)